MSAAWAEPLFRRIAVPRLPGSPGVAQVQEAIARRLEELGYAVERHTFHTSARRITAAVVAGAGLGWTALLSAPLLLVPVPGWGVALAGVAALAFVALLAHGIAAGRLPLAQPLVRGTNIVARRDDPRIWLVAHSDSKAQVPSLLGRVGATALALTGAAALVVCLGLSMAGPVSPWLAGAACGAAAIGGGVLSLGRLRDGSPGAVDNATGVIAVLRAAELLRERDDVGVLITDAEELGLEGARAWVASGPPGEAFVNVDGVDDRGAYRVMRHRPPGEAGVSGTSSPAAPEERDMAREIAAALRAEGDRVTVGPLPPGVLVDGLVLARAGMAGVTVSRGDAATLRVVHTRRDGVERVSVASALRVGEAIGRVLGARC